MTESPDQVSFRFPPNESVLKSCKPASREAQWLYATRSVLRGVGAREYAALGENQVARYRALPSLVVQENAVEGLLHKLRFAS